MGRSAVALLAALTVAGCAARPRIPLGAPTGDLPKAIDLLDLLATRRSTLRGLRALARTSYVSPEESRRVRQLLVAARPDRLRLDFLSPFGVALVLAAGDGELAVYEPGERTFYRGAASAENLRDFVQVDLPVDSAVDVLLVSPPMLDGEPGIVARDGYGVSLWQGYGNDVRVLWVDEALNPSRYEQRDGDGNVLMRVVYGEFARRNGVSVPSRIRIELPRDKRSVTIELRDIEVNPVLADGDFVLEVPGGSREIPIGQVPQ
jgi:hypothetical protein